MRILMVCRYDWAGAVYGLMEAVNEHTGHLARAVTFHTTPLAYPHDVLDPNLVDLWRLLEWAEVLNLYDGVAPAVPEEILSKKAVVKSYLGSEYRRNWRNFNERDAERGWPQTCTTIDLSLRGPTWLGQPMADEAGERKPNDDFTVCHAPTNRIGKGTAIVIEALDSLANIKLDIIEGLPHAECMERKARASVLVDQVGSLSSVGYGRNSLEAWVLGMPVVSDAPDEVCRAIEQRTGELPFYRAGTAGEVRAAVEELHADPDLYAEWHDRGKRFLHGWHDPATIAGRFGQICERAGSARRKRGYDPGTYWEWRGRDYEAEESPDELESLGDWLKSLGAKRILEVGPGWGRVYLKWQSLGLDGSFAMCDFVNSMRDGCERATGVRPDSWDGKRLPYSDDSFDLVLSFSTMLHVPPGDIKVLLAEHARVADRWLFVATLDSFDGQLSPHCFVHDYGSLFEGSGLAVVRKREFGDRAHWLLRKEPYGVD